MQQKCSKPHHSAPSEPAHFLLKSLEDIDAGKAGVWLNLELGTFLFSLKNA